MCDQFLAPDINIVLDQAQLYYRYVTIFQEGFFCWGGGGVTEQNKILKQITVTWSLNQKDQQEQHCRPGKSQAVLMYPIDHQQLQPLPRKTEESRGAGSEVRGGE